jgi:hypothetical protein
MSCSFEILRRRAGTPAARSHDVNTGAGAKVPLVQQRAFPNEWEDRPVQLLGRAVRRSEASAAAVDAVEFEVLDGPPRPELASCGRLRSRNFKCRQSPNAISS